MLPVCHGGRHVAALARSSSISRVVYQRQHSRSRHNALPFISVNGGGCCESDPSVGACVCLCESLDRTSSTQHLFYMIPSNLLPGQRPHRETLSRSLERLCFHDAEARNRFKMLSGSLAILRGLNSVYPARCKEHRGIWWTRGGRVFVEN